MAKKTNKTLKALRDKLFARQAPEPVDVDCGDGIVIRLRQPNGGEVQRATMKHTSAKRKGKGAVSVTDSVGVLHELIHICSLDPGSDEQVWGLGEVEEIGKLPHEFLTPLVAVMGGFIAPRAKADPGN